MPVAVKDNVDMAGELTSHGTGAVEGAATADAEVSVQLISRPNDDRTLVSVAAQLERATAWTERRPPVS